jgi:hypothetical protein
MARETVYVVQAFSRDKAGQLVAEPPVPAKSAADAKDRALRMKDVRTGVIVFSRTGDLELGEYDDAVVIARYGEVPDDQDPD